MCVQRFQSVRARGWRSASAGLMALWSQGVRRSEPGPARRWRRCWADSPCCGRTRAPDAGGAPPRANVTVAVELGSACAGRTGVRFGRPGAQLNRPHAHCVRCPPRGRTVRCRARPGAHWMSKFHRLPVANVERETRDAVAITFAVPEALRRAIPVRGRPAPDTARRHRWRGCAALVFDLFRRAGWDPAHRGEAQSGRRVLGAGRTSRSRPATRST